jgi:hypothetical protein
MRLSVIAVSLGLLFSQSAVAQHSSGGGGSSGGGTSSGGSSSASSGGGSHGGSYSGGGSSSGGHVSGGSSGSSASGSSGSAPATSTHAASGLLHALDKIGLHDSTKPGGEPAFYSSVPGGSSELHNELLNQALARIQLAVPANLKNDEPIAMKSLKATEPGSDRKTEVKAETKTEEPDRKPCRVHRCTPRPVTHNFFAIGTNWRMSRDLYTTIQDDCGSLAAKLAKEESKIVNIQTRRDNVCAINSGGSDCAAAYTALYKLNGKINQLHDRYDQCVLRDLRHNAAVYISQK